MLALLAQGDTGVVRVNQKLRDALLHGQPVEPEIGEHHWTRLTSTMERGSRKSTATTISTLIEVAVIANEIKTAARDAKRLLQECFNKGLLEKDAAFLDSGVFL